MTKANAGIVFVTDVFHVSHCVVLVDFTGDVFTAKVTKILSHRVSGLTTSCSGGLRGDGYSLGGGGDGAENSD